jgi:hypothetical protein
MAEVGMTIAAARRRAHCYENGFGIAYRARQFGRKDEPAGLRVGLHNALQIGLEDRNLSARQRGYLDVILVDAGDVMPEISKTGARNQSHISRSYDNDPHELNTFLFGQLPDGESVRSMTHAGQKTAALHSAHRATSQGRIVIIHSIA